VNAIEKTLLVSVVSLVVSLAGCKAKESSPNEPNAQSTQQYQNSPGQEQSAPSPALEIDLRYMGRPIQEFTSAEPAFSFNNRDTGEKGIPAGIEYRGGRHLVQELAPGNYVLFVSINANPDNPEGYPGYPGDFFYMDSGLSIAADGGVRLDVDLQQVIHLILPQDNAGVMERWGQRGQEMIAFAAPVEFAWDALTDGALYDFSIYRMQSEPHKYLERDVVKETTQTTRVSLYLAPSADNEFYLFRLGATKGPSPIGGIVTHGQRGYGTDFRFRVK
jgi:hypothetical protein